MGESMTIKLTLSYDGTHFAGWQRQKNAISVQEELERALFSLTGKNTTVVGSGRTDAGVHAEGQVASFNVEECSIPPEKFAVALNTILPNGVRAIKSERVEDSFNACRSAKRKTYRYSIYNSKIELPLKERYAVQIEEKLDYKKMQLAVSLFVGEHDFKAFAASGYSAKTTVRNIYSFTVKKSGDDYAFLVCGNGFLYNMVRILVGTVVAVGAGKIKLEDITEMLKTGKRDKNIKTLNAKGLCLVSVEYI